MGALKYLLPIYALIFVFWGFRNVKGFLLFTGVVTMPFRTTYTIVDVGSYVGWTNGINVTLSDISFICLFIYLVLTRRGFGGLSGKLVVPTMFFIGSAVLSVVSSTWTRMSMYEVILLLQVFFLYYVVLTSAIESESELRLVIIGLMVSLIIQGGFGVAQYLTGRDLDIFVTGTPPTDMTEEGVVTRALGTTGKPNGLAMYIVPLLLLGSVILMRSKRFYRKLVVVALVVGGFALLFSYSRGGWAAFLVAFLVLTVFLARRGYITTRSAFLAFLVLVFCGVIFYPQIHGRLVSEEGADAAIDRIYLVKIAWNMIKDSPLIGIGANTFMSVVHNYTRGPDLNYIYLHMVHNQYLLVFAETGIAGLLAFLWFLFACFREAVASVRVGKGELVQLVGLGAGVSFTAMAIHMMVDMYSSPLCLSMLFFFCSLCSAARKVQAAESEPVRRIVYAQRPRVSESPA